MRVINTIILILKELSFVQIIYLYVELLLELLLMIKIVYKNMYSGVIILTILGVGTSNGETSAEIVIIN